MPTPRPDPSRSFEAPVPHTAYPFGGFVADSLLGVRLRGSAPQERRGTA